MFTIYMCLEHYLLFPDEATVLVKLIGKYASLNLQQRLLFS